MEKFNESLMNFRLLTNYFNFQSCIIKVCLISNSLLYVLRTQGVASHKTASNGGGWRKTRPSDETTDKNEIQE